MKTTNHLNHLNLEQIKTMLYEMKQSYFNNDKGMKKLFMSYTKKFGIYIKKLLILIKEITQKINQNQMSEKNDRIDSIFEEEEEEEEIEINS
eukprot:gene8911-859_t